ncbi:hypothetical protein BJ165DRAFT_1525709 [Panaeolus papilionaceus]|nr:hypothetical protein BJ165DRAFT_1525709 [Panaeolus papilionaceus]
MDPSIFTCNADKALGPILPRELECKIFELAAQESLRTCAQLLLVARRVHYWLKPVLYSVLILNDTKPPSLPLYIESEARRQKKCDEINPALSHFAHMIKHVLIRQRFISDISNVLQHCTDIQNLTMWIPYGDCSSLVPILEAQPSLRRISFDPSLFFRSWDEDTPIPFNLPMFRNITHLEVISATPSWSKWQYLEALPSLTHLALGGVVSRVLIRNLLRRCERLQVLVIYYFAGISVWETGYSEIEDEVDERVEDDGRLMVLTTARFPGLVEMWERGARGGDGFWELVQNIKNDECGA